MNKEREAALISELRAVMMQTLNNAVLEHALERADLSDAFQNLAQFRGCWRVPESVDSLYHLVQTARQVVEDLLERSKDDRKDSKLYYPSTESDSEKRKDDKQG